MLRAASLLRRFAGRFRTALATLVVAAFAASLAFSFQTRTGPASAPRAVSWSVASHLALAIVLLAGLKLLEPALKALASL